MYEHWKENVTIFAALISVIGVLNMYKKKITGEIWRFVHPLKLCSSRETEFFLLNRFSYLLVCVGNIVTHELMTLRKGHINAINAVLKFHDMGKHFMKVKKYFLSYLLFSFKGGDTHKVHKYKINPYIVR